MKLGSLASARPAYYDRNAASSGVLVDVAVAPHAQVTRATQTIAAGKKANVESAAGYIIQSTVATAIARRLMLLRITDAAAQTYDIVRIDGASSLTQNAFQAGVGGGQPTIYAGESITVSTVDNSTGGVIGYTIYAKLTLYDV